jgi:hypothetical protein
MRHYINFGYQPPNVENLIKQYIRTNRGSLSASAEQRDSILKSMLNQTSSIEPLSHVIKHKGKTRYPITGLTKIQTTGVGDYPSAHVALVASAPRKSFLANQSATDDLADRLYRQLGDNGMFDLVPNRKEVSKIYQKKLGTDIAGQGNGRGLRKVIKSRPILK